MSLNIPNSFPSDSNSNAIFSSNSSFQKKKPMILPLDLHSVSSNSNYHEINSMLISLEIVVIIIITWKKKGRFQDWMNHNLKVDNNKTKIEKYEFLKALKKCIVGTQNQKRMREWE